MAGEAAAQVARRMRDRAERQLRPAEHAVSCVPVECATASALASLPATTWRVLNDVALPGRARSNVDHIAIGPGGVFIIESKRWSGQVEVRDDQLRHDGRLRESAVTGVAEAALALTPIVARVTGRAVVPVLCFASDEPLSGWVRDAMVCSTVNVVSMLSGRLPLLTPAQVHSVALAVDEALQEPDVRAPLPPRGSAAPDRTTADSWPQLRISSSPARSGRSRLSSVAQLVAGLTLLGVALVPPVQTVVTGTVVDLFTERTELTTSEPTDETDTAKNRQQRRERRQVEQQSRQQP